MNGGGAARGQPIYALGGIAACWVTARVLLWDVTMPVPVVRDALERPAPLPAAMRVAASGEPGLADRLMPARQASGADVPARPESTAIMPKALMPQPMDLAAPQPLAPVPPLASRMAAAPLTPALPPTPVPMAVSHQVMRMAALSRIPLPPGLLAVVTSRQRGAALPATLAKGAASPRWSGDGWLLLRRGGAGVLVGGARPASYGDSQAGAVLRYRLAPGSGHRPAAYLRASAALAGGTDREAAIGLAARPLAHIPVVAAVEARLAGQGTGTRLRPAAMVYSEMLPVALPHEGRAEIYAQAGYVGGGNATLFVDGHARIDRALPGTESFDLRAGAGLWGGAQKGAARLDAGPTATMGIALGGGASARLALDWRFRMAGNAAPASGPSLTLSAGF